MTTLEFSNEFDISYDNVASKNAPGLDLYEKSVYLTRAQLELVKNKYNPKGNKYNSGFEGSQKRINDLKELVEPYSSSTFFQNSNNISSTAKFTKVPNDLFLIIYENIEFDTTNTCLQNRKIKVVPKTHDEYNRQISNPFKKPSEELVWRLEISKQGEDKIVEIESTIPVKNYYCRYIKFPKPIILTDLSSGDFTEMGLSIDGFTNEQGCELHESVHPEIINRAVEMAVLDYKDGRLESKVQLNLRNE